MKVVLSILTVILTVYTTASPLGFGALGGTGKFGTLPGASILASDESSARDEDSGDTAGLSKLGLPGPKIASTAIATASGGLPGVPAVPGGLGSAVPGGLASKVPEGLASGVTGGVASGVTGGLASKVPGSLASAVPGGLGSAVPGGLSGGLPGVSGLGAGLPGTEILGQIASFDPTKLTELPPPFNLFAPFIMPVIKFLQTLFLGGAVGGATATVTGVAGNAL